MRLVFLALALAAAPQSREKELWEKLEPLFAPPAEFRNTLAPLRPLLKFSDGRDVKTPEEWKERRSEILGHWNELLGPWPPLLETPVVQEQWKETVEDF